MLKENDDMKKKSKLQKHQQFVRDFNLFLKQCYCMVWTAEKNRKYTSVAKTNKGKLLFSLKYAVCDSKILILVKNQEASRLLKFMSAIKLFFVIK